MIVSETFKKIQKEYGTPAFVFDADEVRGRASDIKNILNSTDKKIGLCYSIKANPFLIPHLIDLVDMFEVCSPGELKICKKYSVPGEMIIYSGVNKGKEDVKEAVEYDAKILTAESLKHYELIKSAAKELGKKVSVVLRLSSKSQFGMSKEDIEGIFEDEIAGSSENIGNEKGFVNIVGLHYFAGTQRLKLKHQIKELEELKEYFIELRNKYNIELPWFEYGPGLGYPYFEDEDFSDTLRPVKELAPELINASEYSSLTVEMGRFLASSCGYYMTEVVDLKKSYDRNWCILDGGINHVNYLGQMMGLKIPVMHHISDKANLENKALDSNATSWALCGSLCTTGDVLVREYSAENISISDLFVFCNIGAYSVTEGINLFLSRNMPKIILYRDGKCSLIRDTIETWKLNS